MLSSGIFNMTLIKCECAALLVDRADLCWSINQFLIRGFSLGITEFSYLDEGLGNHTHRRGGEAFYSQRRSLRCHGK